MKGIDKIIGPLVGTVWCCQKIFAVEILEGVKWNNRDEGCGEIREPSDLIIKIK